MDEGTARERLRGATGGCDGNCPSCAQAFQREPEGGLRGGKLGLAVAAGFLFPLLLALAGAVWLEDYPLWQALGALAGLTVGAILAARLVGALRAEPAGVGSADRDEERG